MTDTHVHYELPSGPNKGEARLAVVTRVNDDDSLNLSVFVDKSDALSQTGLLQVRGVSAAYVGKDPAGANKNAKAWRLAEEKRLADEAEAKRQAAIDLREKADRLTQEIEDAELEAANADSDADAAVTKLADLRRQSAEVSKAAAEAEEAAGPLDAKPDSEPKTEPKSDGDGDKTEPDGETGDEGKDKTGDEDPKGGEGDGSPAPFDAEKATYPELQAEAKRRGIPANQSAQSLREALG